ncbi:MAG: NAD(P)/FAD-dependent oxidoreductase [Candidatus Lokiarchaeota archaeon]|nr:NAD(P)/FAD-dependent oxidoreductase [Candidatus Lokiarchaeota archaeon]
MLYDFAIIGAGVTGTAIARELSKYKVSAIVIEKLSDVACETSKANSGIIHAGYDAPSGSWKAKMNVRSNPLYDDICKELYIPFRRLGSLVVALAGQGTDYIEELYQHGVERDIPVEIIKELSQIKKMEPNITDDVEVVLHAPTAGVISPFTLAIALAENANINGVEFVFNAPVQAIENMGKFFIVDTPGKSFQARAIINASGLFADEISRMAGDESFKITPRKGEYILLDKMGDYVRKVLFPVPTKKSKGILVSPTVDGNVFLGPNARDQDSKLDNSTSLHGLDEVIEGGRKLIPRIPLVESITNFAGLRAVSSTNDFIIGESKVTPKLFQAAGIQSPGLSSCLGIAEEVVDAVKASGIELKLKENFNPTREKPIVFAELPWSERDALAQWNKQFGHIICRCETVTEGEIVQAIRRPVGARTVDGVKFRTRVGMGRCQGGFCTPRVIKILARELGVEEDEIVKREPSTKYFFGETKEFRQPRAASVNGSEVARP